MAETATADGSRPRSGTRVVGILPSGACAERVNCRSHAVAALPDAVDDVEEATLPVVGRTALHALIHSAEGELNHGGKPACQSMNTEKTNGEFTPPAITSFSPARSGASSVRK